MKLRKLLLAGSHAATTAYATVQEIKKRKLPWEIHFIGRKWSGEDRKSESLEFKELPKLGVRFHPLESGKIQTKFTRHTIPAIFKIPFGFIHSFLMLSKIKPDMALSFGGASGAQVCFASWLLGIPVIIHEQTSVAGRANIFSSRFARKIAVSRESCRGYFPREKTVVTGNPLTSEITEAAKENPRESVKTIFVTGGSRGSQRINKAVEGISPRLREKYEIIHLTGTGNGRLSIRQMAKAFKKADIVVSRAGANTVAEIIALKKPCILIPIPWSYLDEQSKNAEYAKQVGLARIIHQDELTPQRLLSEIKLLISDYPEIIKKISPGTSADIKASAKLVDLVNETLEKIR